MNNEQFVFWLRGFLSKDESETKFLNSGEIKKIIEILNKVEEQNIMGFRLKTTEE